MMIGRAIYALGVHILVTTPSTASAGRLPAGPMGDGISAAVAAVGDATSSRTTVAAATAAAEAVVDACVMEAETKDTLNRRTATGQSHQGYAPEPPSCTFFLIRHGQSKPNMAGKIVSGMEGGIDLENGLTAEGLEQARAAGRELKEVMLKAGCLPANTIILSSPFSRAKETAEAIKECLDCELREERDLRERWFGDLDGKDDAASYSKVWALDAVSSLHREFGVEPASAVAARAAAVVRRARKEVSIRQRFHTGDGQPFPPGPSAVVLVSHGDALQLLQCLLAGRPLEQHRSLPHLENCGIRALRPPPEKEGLEERGEVEGAGGDGTEEGVKSSDAAKVGDEVSEVVDLDGFSAIRGVRVLRRRVDGDGAGGDRAGGDRAGDSADSVSRED